MDVVGDLVARDRRSDALALRTDSRAGSYSYEKLCTNAWKAGNLLSHYGVRGDATVVIDAGESLSPPPLTAFLGAALLGATVRFEPPESGRSGRSGPPESVETRALVVPASRIEVYDPAPGTTVLAYGDVPEGPTVTHFEREVWSENPTTPPNEVAPDDALLAVDADRVTHRRAVEAAERVAEEVGLNEADLVAPRASLTDPAVVVAGVLAPLSVGGSILLEESVTGDVGVGSEGDVKEPQRIDPSDVF
jgi:hypothetical protein